MPPMLMKHSEDPKETIYSKIGMKKGVIPGFHLQGNRVLLAIYERPKVTASGIHLADTTRAEDSIQGKAALVVMLGSSAFVDDSVFKFDPDDVRKVGDWVLCFVSHGLRCAINGQPCRIIRDQDITMLIPAPDQVW